jgi:hypothetical protein
VVIIRINDPAEAVPAPGSFVLDDDGEVGVVVDTPTGPGVLWLERYARENSTVSLAVEPLGARDVRLPAMRVD